MMPIAELGRAGRALPHLADHIGNYAALAAAELAHAIDLWKRRFVVLVVAAIAALLGIQVACVSLIASTWDSPYRLSCIAAVIGAFGAVAIAGFICAARQWSEQRQAFETLRREWTKDRQLLQHWWNQNVEFH